MVTPILLSVIKVIVSIDKFFMNSYTHIIVIAFKDKLFLFWLTQLAEKQTIYNSLFSVVHEISA